MLKFSEVFRTTLFLNPRLLFNNVCKDCLMLEVLNSIHAWQHNEKHLNSKIKRYDTNAFNIIVYIIITLILLHPNIRV